MRTLSREEFIEKLWNLNDKGDAAATYSYLLRTFIERDVYTFNQELVTFDLIVQKYTEYNNWWNHSFADMDPKYLKKDKEKVTISTFLIKAMYQQTFESPKKKRDSYLFGNFSRKELNEKVTKFNAQFYAGTKEIETKDVEPLF